MIMYVTFAHSYLNPEKKTNPTHSYNGLVYI